MFQRSGYLVALVFACLFVSSVVFAQSGGITASLQPFIVDIQQAVPIEAEVSIPYGEGSITATVPLTMNVNLQIDIASAQIANISAESSTPNIFVQVPTTLPGKDEPLPIENLNVIFRDDFSKPETGWNAEGGGGSDFAGYMNGEMVLTDSYRPVYFTSDGRAFPGLRFDDFIYRTDVRWSGGSVGGRMGLYFRFQDQNNTYYLSIGNDGLYRLGKFASHSDTIIDEDFSDAIDRNGGINTVQVEARGSSLRVFINDVLVVEAQDVDHDFGDIGFFAIRPEGGEFFEASFDNVIVAKYPE